MKLNRSTKNYQVVIGLMFQFTLKSWKKNTEIMVKLLNSNFYVLENVIVMQFSRKYIETEVKVKLIKWREQRIWHVITIFPWLLVDLTKTLSFFKLAIFFVKFSTFLILFSFLFPFSLRKFLIFSHQIVELPFHTIYGI